MLARLTRNGGRVLVVIINHKLHHLLYLVCITIPGGDISPPEFCAPDNLERTANTTTNQISLLITTTNDLFPTPAIATTGQQQVTNHRPQPLTTTNNNNQTHRISSSP
jgi:hypothetical protein